MNNHKIWYSKVNYYVCALLRYRNSPHTTYMLILNLKYVFIDFAAPKLQCTMLCRLGTGNWDQNESEWMCVEVWESLRNRDSMYTRGTLRSIRISWLAKISTLYRDLLRSLN